VFSTAPQWDIVNDSNIIVLSGTAIISSTDADGWDITFTVPTSYQSITDNDTLTLELFGADTNGKVRSTEAVFSLMDAADDFIDSVVIAMDNEDIEDSLILPYDNIPESSISVTIQDLHGAYLAKNVTPTIANILRVANMSDVPDRFTERDFKGFRYDIELPGITFPNLTRAPYQMIYRIKSVSPKIRETQIRPLVRINSKFINFISRLRMYLDKARLTEIDPTIQWRDDELAVAVISGIDHINNHPTVYTFWTVEDIPTPIHSAVEKAAAFYALNTRYLAEGFNAFEFQGLSTSLTMDRREAISYKIEELKSYLDTNLTNMKSIAISTFGKGIPDSSVNNKESRAILVTQNSPVHNRVGFGGFSNYSMQYQSRRR
jgi:hypothetical protein